MRTLRWHRLTLQFYWAPFTSYRAAAHVAEGHNAQQAADMFSTEQIEIVV